MDAARVAGMLALIGVIGVAVAALNILALRAVRIDDVPACAQSRIRWWGAHNSAVLIACAALTILSLGGLVIS